MCPQVTGDQQKAQWKEVRLGEKSLQQHKHGDKLKPCTGDRASGRRESSKVRLCAEASRAASRRTPPALVYSHLFIVNASPNHCLGTMKWNFK